MWRVAGDVAAHADALLLHTEIPEEARLSAASPLFRLLQGGLPAGCRLLTYHNLTEDWACRQQRMALTRAARASSADAEAATAFAGAASADSARLVAGSVIALSALATAQAAATSGGVAVSVSGASQLATEPPAPFRQLPVNVPESDVFYTSWSPHRGYHLYCWERV
jgi:hypothetical protein